MQVRIVVETPSKGLLYDDLAQAYPVSVPRPLVNYCSTQCRQIVLQDKGET